MHMVTRGLQYSIPGFPLHKWEIRHFDPNLACLHFQLQSRFCFVAGRPGTSEVPRNPLTRWDVSSIPANGIFLTKKLKKQK